MRIKKFRLLIYFFIIILIVISLFVIIDFKQRIEYERINLDSGDFLSEYEKQNDIKDLRTKTDKDKTYIYISIGKQVNINFKITKIKEEEDKVVIYAKETGHCNPIKEWKESRAKNDLPMPFYWHIYQTYSIKKTDKPIEIVWEKYVSCSIYKIHKIKYLQTEQ